MGTIVVQTRIMPGAAAAAFAFCLGAPSAIAGALVGTDAMPPAAAPAAARPLLIHQLDTEMVVHDWVLCISEDFAEQLARARAVSVERANAAYAGLRENRSCGQFAELLLILRKRLYSSPVESGHDARVFAAEIRLADDWASAYVVYGGLPERSE